MNLSNVRCLAEHDEKHTYCWAICSCQSAGKILTDSEAGHHQANLI